MRENRYLTVIGINKRHSTAAIARKENTPNVVQCLKQWLNKYCCREAQQQLVLAAKYAAILQVAEEQLSG